MKKILLLFGFALAATVSAQSTDQSIILKDTQESTVFMEKKDPSFYISKMHPAVYDHMNKEQLMKSFTSVAEGTADYKVNVLSVDEAKIRVSDVMTGTNGKYALVMVPIPMQMTFFKNFDEKYKNQLVDSFAKQGITPLFRTNNSIEFTKNAFILAIKNDRTEDQWRYLNYEPNNDMVQKISRDDVMVFAEQTSARFAKGGSAQVKEEAVKTKAKPAKKK